METRTTRVLLVEDDTEQAGLIRKMLAKTGNGFTIDWVSQLSEGLVRLDQGDIDAVILDLSLPDSKGLDTFISAHKHQPQIPFVVLTGLADEKLGLAAVRQGAQDYLIKGQVDGPLLFRSLSYAIERRRSQEALLAERRRLYSLLDALPAIVSVCAPDYTVRFANRGFRELFGAPEGKHCYQIFHDRTTPCEVCPAEEIFRTQKSKMWEDMRSDSGRTYHIHHYPFSDLDGSPLVLNLGIDITERKRMEEALQAEEQFLEDIFNSIQDGLTVMDLDRTVIRVNPAMRKFPCTEPILGRKCYEVYHGRSQICEPCPVTQTLKTGKAGYGCVEAIDGDSAVKVSEIYSYPLINHKTGKIQGVIEYVRDVTERHRMEQALRETEGRFQQVFEDAGDAMILHDKGRIIDVNRQACRSLGYSKEELVRMSVFDIELSLDQEFLTDLWERANGGIISLAGVYQRKDGSTFPVAIHSGEVTFGGRKFRLATIRDVTEQRRAEEALKDSEKKLRFLTEQLLTAQEAERKRLSQGLHDELGHALLSMKLDLHAMEKQLLPEQTGLAENLTELTGYVDEVIENVRRLYLGLTPGDLEDLGLTAALKSLCEEFGRHQERISWSVHLEKIDALLPITVQTAIYRIFQEILTNIGKHADPTQVSVFVKRKNNRAIFEVEDNGRGFDVQAGWQHSPKAGMGLLAMEERVRMLGGDLQVWSREDQGTKITFTIPLEHKAGELQAAD